jgi:hypothetical protein
MTFYSQIDTSGLKIINLGQGVNPADAINKQQLDNAIAAVQTTASNGVKKVGNDIRLGGTITALTTIDALSNPILITNSILQLSGNGAVAGSGPFAAQNNAALNILFCENHGRVGMSGYFDIMATATTQFGGQPITVLPVNRQNAIFVKTASSTTATAIHIEFNKTLTAAAWDLMVEMKGCFPQNTNNLANTYAINTYCQMNNTTIALQQNLGIQGTQNITWYISSTGKPVMKLHTFVGLTLGNASFSVQLFKGAFDEIPDISRVVFNVNTNI